MNALVLTNMYSTPQEPAAGVFVSEQVDDPRALGIAVSVLAFDDWQKRRNDVRTAGRPKTRPNHEAVDIVHAHYGLPGAVALSQRQVVIG